MKLTILGTGGYSPDTPHASAGYVVEAGNTIVKLDFGRGNLLRMAEAGIDWKAIDVLCISHTHPDHVSDLVSYFQAYTWGQVGGDVSEELDLQIFAPKGFTQYFENLKQVVHTAWDEMNNLPTIIEMENSEQQIGDVHIRSARVNHAPNLHPIGFRIEHNDATLCYTGDSGYCEELVDLARGADVFLADCYEDNASTGGHLRPTEVVAIAEKAQVPTIVLTHLPGQKAARAQRLKEAQAEFSGSVILAEDGMVIDI